MNSLSRSNQGLLPQGVLNTAGGRYLDWTWITNNTAQNTAMVKMCGDHCSDYLKQ